MDVGCYDGSVIDGIRLDWIRIWEEANVGTFAFIEEHAPPTAPGGDGGEVGLQLVRIDGGLDGFGAFGVISK